MFELIYQTLTNFGYNHPIHPTLTHVPIGMVMGAFIFVLIAVIARKKNLAQTARHCSVLALIAAVPTALLGLMDWQHFYGGAILFPMGKMPPFGHLPPEQVETLVADLRTL
ncbi:MAG: DUF2231 domain-containing protein [Desulfobacterales bacterium]|jgi:uncharacterized membrane protein